MAKYLLLVLLLIQTAWAQPTDEQLERIDAIFAAFASSDSPGCTVGAYDASGLIAARAYGMANLDHDVPLTPASVLHVASVAKQFTAAAILLLAQDGVLSLDDDVRTYIPELPNFGPPITIRQLAHHTSGLRDQWTILGLAGWRYSRDLITDDDVLDMLALQKELNFEPGERHLYSNSGYTLMAMIVSRVSGKSLREFTTERIFAPLGMTRTHFRDDFNEIVKQQAYGYAPARSGWRLSVTNFDTTGATSLLTTVEDLARWHANLAAPVVGGESLMAGLLERGVLNDGQPIDYAFGLVHDTYRGLPTVGHGGGDAGYRSMFLRFPTRDFGVAVLCNSAAANPEDLAERVADVFLAPYLSARAEAAQDGPEVPVSPQRLAELAGVFWNAEDAVRLRFDAEDDGLHVSFPGGRQRVTSLGEERFLLLVGARIELEFESDAAGSPARLRLNDGRSDTLYERIAPYSPAAEQLDELGGTYRSDELATTYRITVQEGELHLERLKARPAVLEPIMLDTFTSSLGTIRFVRDSSGSVTGFLLDAGRVRHLRFEKET